MVLVFGAGGFIASYVVDQLLKDGQKVIGSDMTEEGGDFYRQQKIPYFKIDITNKRDFEQLPSQGIEAVIHLACVQPANVSEEQYKAEDYIRVNVLGTLNILEYCRESKIKKIIYTCSHRNTQGMWESKRGQPILESDGRSMLFTGDYAMFSLSESAATDCVEHYAQTFGIQSIVLRLPPVYGYGPHTVIFKDGKPLKTGFQIFIEQAEKSLPLEIWGNPENGRDIVYVKDVATAFSLALKTPGVQGLFNISSGRRLTLREQVESIIRVFSPKGKPSSIQLNPGKENFIESYFYGIGKAKQAFGWEPKYSFEDMLVDFQKEKESGRFSFLVEKRKKMMREIQCK